MAAEDLTEDQRQLLMKMWRDGQLSRADAMRLGLTITAEPRSLPAGAGGAAVTPPPPDQRSWGQWGIEEGLPIAGAIIGGVGGTLAGGPPGGYAGAGAGAGLVRAAVPSVAEYFGYEPSPPMTGSRAGDVALETLLGGAGELGARTAITAGVNLYRPALLGTTSLRPARTAAQRIAEIEAVGAEPILADVLETGANAARREQALSMTPGGAPIIQDTRTQRARALTGEGERTRLAVGPASTAMERGTEAGAAIERTMANMTAAENAAWNRLRVNVGSPTPIPNPALKRTAAALLREQQLLDAVQQDTGFIRLLQSIINGPDEIAFEALLKRRSDYLDEAGRPLLVRGKNAAAYSRLASATMDDIGAGVRAIDPRFAALHGRARQLTARKHELIEDMGINKLRDMDPEQIAKLVGGQLSESSLTRLRSVLLGTVGVGPTQGGRDAWNKIRRAIMDRAFEGGEGFENPRVLIGGTDGVATLNPEKLRRNFDKIGGIGVLLDPHERIAFNNIQRAADAMARSARAGHPVGSQTAQAQAFGSGGGKQALTGAVGAAVTGAIVHAAGGGPLLTAGISTVGGVAASQALTIRQRMAARMLTSPGLARQLASPTVTRWIEEFERTGVMPRMLARIFSQTAAGSATSVRPER